MTAVASRCERIPPGELPPQLNYNLLYRWFVGLSPDDPIWDPTTFTKNRDRRRGRVAAIRRWCG
jgi:hypothetical protein